MTGPLETSLDRWLTKRHIELAPEERRELDALVRTAQREAAARGFKAGFNEAFGYFDQADEDEVWAASALHAELEDPT